MDLRYNWQQADWPRFRYALEPLSELLIEFATASGYAKGILSALPSGDQQAALLHTLIAETMKTSEIEGEYLSRSDVYASIQYQLGLTSSPIRVNDRRAEAISAVIIDARQTFAEPLTEAMLTQWHNTLFQEDRRLRVIGAWRQGSDPMRVVSGSLGRETVHFEAPPSERVPAEMAEFIRWFNATALDGSEAIASAPLRAAIAHLYFESIHPFEDGNGRIGRAIAEKALAQTLGFAPILSLSSALEAGHKQYYLDLESAQRGNEITHWLVQFVKVLIKAQESAIEWVQFLINKTKFYDQYRDVMNERQAKVIERMLESGPNGFIGGINATKYLSLTGVSKATATRDLQDLVTAGVLVRVPESGGRSIRYELNINT